MSTFSPADGMIMLVCVHVVCVCACVFTLSQYWINWYVDMPTLWTLQVHSVHTHTHMHAYTHICMRTHTHTQTYMHAHTHTHTHTLFEDHKLIGLKVDITYPPLFTVYLFFSPQSHPAVLCEHSGIVDTVLYVHYKLKSTHSDTYSLSLIGCFAADDLICRCWAHQGL